MTWLQKLFHRHEWRDWFEFDSSFSVSIPDGKTTVTGRAVMMKCGCGAMQRRYPA